jgi:HSP90 family molecular chaperone
MSIGSLNPLSNTYLQSILTSAIQSTGLTTNSANNSLSTSAASSITQAPDNSQLSRFAQLMSELQKLQQTDPAKYQQVTQQIATNLQTAAQTATAAGDTTKAAQLTQLATDFSNASKSGQLPNMQDLAQAMGGHHHRHHHVEAASTDPASTSSTTPTSSASQTLSQLLAAFQANGTQTGSTDPLGIIMSTLSSAGISGT